MGIKLEVYLKRTGQTMEAWMEANGILDSKDLVPRCAYIGLSVEHTDILTATEILKKKKQRQKEEKAAKVEQVDEQAAVQKKPKKKDVAPSEES